MIPEPTVTRAIIKERHKYLEIIYPPADYRGRTFEISTKLAERYTEALSQLQTIEHEIIHAARKQKAYPPFQDKPIPKRYRLEEGEIHAFEDDGTVRIKKKSV